MSEGFKFLEVAGNISLLLVASTHLSLSAHCPQRHTCTLCLLSDRFPVNGMNGYMDEWQHRNTSRFSTNLF